MPRKKMVGGMTRKRHYATRSLCYGEPKKEGKYRERSLGLLGAALLLRYSSLLVGDQLPAILPGVHRGRLLIHEIDLLEGKTLGLGNAEVGEDKAAETCATPDEEHLRLEASRSGLLVDKVGGGITDTKVPQPIAGNRERHGLCTNLQGENFTGDNPGDRTPCGCEEGNVNANESDEHTLTSQVVNRDGDTNDGDDELANTHASSADQEEAAATIALDAVHSRQSHEDVDDGSSDGNQETVLNTRVLEEGCAVVENEVNAGELLEGLDEDTREGTERNLVLAELEAIDVRALAESQLLLEVGVDLLELCLNFGIISGKAGDSAEGDNGSFIFALADKPSGRLRQEEHARSENEGPDELNGNRNAVR